MGWIKAKCPQCWDVIPCDCDEQRERDNSLSNVIASQEREQEREKLKLLREQNELLRKLIRNKK